MLTDAQRDQLKQYLLPMQIIVGAMAAGALTFLGISLLFNPRGGVQPGRTPMLTYIGGGAAVVGLIAWTVLPNLVSKQTRTSVLEGDARRLAVNFQTRPIIGCALLEGIAFLNIVAHTIERQNVSLIVAGVFLLLLLSQFPTLDRLERWIESEFVAVKQ